MSINQLGAAQNNLLSTTLAPTAPQFPPPIGIMPIPGMPGLDPKVIDSINKLVTGIGAGIGASAGSAAGAIGGALAGYELAKQIGMDPNKGAVIGAITGAIGGGAGGAFLGTVVAKSFLGEMHKLGII